MTVATKVYVICFSLLSVLLLRMAQSFIGVINNYDNRTPLSPVVDRFIACAREVATLIATSGRRDAPGTMSPLGTQQKVLVRPASMQEFEGIAVEWGPKMKIC